MRKCILFALLVIGTVAAQAQDEEREKEKRGFKKENLFTGGSISVSFFNSSFLIGANPVFGYRIADWIDAGVVVNYQYSSYRNYNLLDDKLRQSIYGGGVFTRLFPINFIFGQAQFEHNFITQKYIPPGGGATQKASTSANSFLVGGGYAQGKVRGFNSGFFYLSILFDVSGNELSPYTDEAGRPVPLLRAGVNIPLFQGRY